MTESNPSIFKSNDESFLYFSKQIFIFYYDLAK